MFRRREGTGSGSHEMLSTHTITPPSARYKDGKHWEGFGMCG